LLLTQHIKTRKKSGHFGKNVCAHTHLFAESGGCQTYHGMVLVSCAWLASKERLLPTQNAIGILTPVQNLFGGKRPHDPQGVGSNKVWSTNVHTHQGIVVATNLAHKQKQNSLH